MESSRRPFDRSREPGPKKPRLMDPSPSGRTFPQRQVGSGITTLASARFRTNNRDLESSDFGRGGDAASGGGYQPQPPPFQELVAQYKTALAELTFNSKPIITNLTIIAGENQSAEKAIASTICANILEVPSEQKLPSLYLLDSIVKNIGRDYIKYFAARLPEVFCKAYRQVDPSVHQSMRHLFGTWKGVFPPQTLQVIEKELGFTPAVNGSSSSSATLRSDSQSQRPPHSIHVNPKYLERQRLQQSGKDNQRTNKDTFNDSVPEKTTGASYGSNEYGSDLSRNLGLGIGRTGGRVTELGHDKSWFKAGVVPGTVSGQRNGFSLKNSFSNIESPKSMILDAHHQPTQNITSTRSNAITNSWKNSEEEEFMWEEMNSGLSGHGASSISNNVSKDSWTVDDENLEVEDQLQIRNPLGANVDREIPIECLATEKKQMPAFRHHPSLSWQLQEQHSIDELNQKPGHSDGFVSMHGALPTNTNSSAGRMGNRPFLPNATIGLAGQQFHSVGTESPSGQSPLRQPSSSPLVTMHYPNPMQNLPDQDCPQTFKTSQFLGGLQSQYIKESSPALPHNAQVGNLRKSQLKDLHGPFSSNTFQPRKQQQLGSSHTEVTVKTVKPPLSKVNLARETLEPSTTSRLEAAAVQSGIFNRPITSSLPTTSSLDTGNLPSQLGVRPCRSGGPSPATVISSVSTIASPSSLGPPNVNLSAIPKIPQRKAGQPPRASSTLRPASSNVSSASALTSSATDNNLNPIANLLSSLVAKGLISAETELLTKEPSEMLIQLEDRSDSITTSSSLPVASVSGSAAVPVPFTKDEIDDTVKTPTSLPEASSTEIRNLIGFEFKPDVIRELNPSVISGLFDDLPHRCSICGLRLKFQEQFNRHLEWHATREKEQNGLIRASRWYPKSNDWIVAKTEYSSENEFTESVDTCSEQTDRNQEGTMVLADEKQCLCVLCGELFEDFYCQENGEWMFKGAIYMTNSDSHSEMGIRDVITGRGPIIHARCLSDNLISRVLKTEQD
ncbi:uncharacterized protein LOC133311651 [Gastrolobium bilobum]|uniref:uncharacterized protein LOC133311651 n=1 Tax=Gastrolobium bilobum TaxID=150636 RepID=UPI002AB03CDA|nr:uncharacterized protein LOC133311651 [Gastrolobium bilobum]